LPSLTTLQVAIIAPVSRFLVAPLRFFFNRLAAFRRSVSRFLAGVGTSHAGKADHLPAVSSFQSPTAAPVIDSKFAGNRPRRLRSRFRARWFSRIGPPRL